MRQLSELEIVQNPSLGAVALWQFCLGFQADHESPAVLPLAFLVLPLLFHRQTLDLINSTQKNSGLALFASKVGKEQEDLLAVHERALVLRTLTLQSISLGVRASLLTINYVEATLRGNQPKQKLKKTMIPERLKGLPGAAEKLGYWFSKTSLGQVATTLRVDF